MFNRFAVAAFALLAFVSVMPTALAAEPEQTSDQAANKGKKGDVTAYVFDDDSIAGEVLRPEGANIASRGKSKAASLITIRAHFINELIKLADDI